MFYLEVHHNTNLTLLLLWDSPYFSKWAINENENKIYYVQVFGALVNYKQPKWAQTKSTISKVVSKFDSIWSCEILIEKSFSNSRAMSVRSRLSMLPSFLKSDFTVNDFLLALGDARTTALTFALISALVGFPVPFSNRVRSKKEAANPWLGMASRLSLG